MNFIELAAFNVAINNSTFDASYNRHYNNYYHYHLTLNSIKSSVEPNSIIHRNRLSFWCHFGVILVSFLWESRYANSNRFMNFFLIIFESFLCHFSDPIRLYIEIECHFSVIILSFLLEIRYLVIFESFCVIFRT